MDVVNKLKSALYCDILATENSEDELLKIYSVANSVLEAATTNSVELNKVIGRDEERSDKILGDKMGVRE